MMHRKHNTSIQGVIRIGVIFTICNCLILTQLAFASSGSNPVILNNFVFDGQKFLPVSGNIENKVEEGTKKILRHETYEEELSNGMIPSDDQKSTLPFYFELPIPFP
jgi:hypothetical protein